MTLLNNSDKIAWNEMISWLCIGIDLKGSGRNMRCYTNISLERLRKTTKPQNSQFAGRDLNAGPPEYEARMLTTTFGNMQSVS
jgi:hypothetical protein